MTTLFVVVPRRSRRSRWSAARSRPRRSRSSPVGERNAPASKLAPTSGTKIVVKADPAGGTAVMLARTTLRAGVSPWLKRMTASAPAVWAFATLRAKLQPPRWISAIAPSGKPAKSSGPAGSAVSGAPTAASANAPSHPLVLARGGVRLMSTGTTAAVSVPMVLPVMEPDGCVRVATGVSCTIGCATAEVELVGVDAPAGVLELLDDVVDACVVPGRTGARGCRRSRRRSPGTPPGARGRPRASRSEQLLIGRSSYGSRSRAEPTTQPPAARSPRALRRVRSSSARHRCLSCLGHGVPPPEFGRPFSLPLRRRFKPRFRRLMCVDAIVVEQRRGRSSRRDTASMPSRSAGEVVERGATRRS